MSRPRSALRAALAAVFVALGACSSPPPAAVPDVDAAADTGASPDVGVDTGPATPDVPPPEDLGATDAPPSGDVAPDATLPDDLPAPEDAPAPRDAPSPDVAPLDVAPPDVAPPDVAPADVAPADVAPPDVARPDAPSPVDAPADVIAPVDAGPSPVLVGAGDIASCLSPGDEATANLLDGIPGTVFTLGDNVYQSGASWEFTLCYAASWGRHRRRTRPAAGNHDYETRRAAGYYDYFGSAAGEPSRGYYSYELGAWHVVVLNSNCSEVGGCGAGSAQERWLRADLAAHPTRCTLAYMHHPRFSSGRHGSDPGMQPFWQALYEAGAEVVLAGHDHNYERFAPQTPTGARDDARGIRQFIVGTGGIFFYSLGSARRPNSEVGNDNTWGVLQLTLNPASYEWRFVPAAGGRFTDMGRGDCH